MTPDFDQLRADAAKAERERIIDMLCNDPAGPWLCIFINGEFAPLGRRRVREALQPTGLAELQALPSD